MQGDAFVEAILKNSELLAGQFDEGTPEQFYKILLNLVNRAIDLDTESTEPIHTTLLMKTFACALQKLYEQNYQERMLMQPGNGYIN
jgi:hypothetical protein